MLLLKTFPPKVGYKIVRCAVWLGIEDAAKGCKNSTGINVWFLGGRNLLCPNRPKQVN